jgi:hypothetical protein
VWLFKVPSRRRRLLTVEFVDLNLAEGCDDHIQVRFVSRRKNPVKTKSKSRPDRRIKRRILETKLCGSAVPVKYKSTRLAHLVEITFKADSIHSSKGFRAIFRGFSKTTIRDVPFDPNDVHNSGIQICYLSPIPRDGDSNNKTLAEIFIDRMRNKDTEPFKVSTVKALNQNVTRFTASYSQLVNATRMYEEYNQKNGTCTVRDVNLAEILANVQSVTWPPNLWRPVSDSSVIDDTIEGTEPTDIKRTINNVEQAS